ncbi:MAG TPA: UPF0175 family protein [Flavipsychrobacter sp.]|nr:UPF0175 family protein [Flavipsychrobacter sp.]
MTVFIKFDYMKTLTINLPDKIEIDAKETIKFLAAKLYEAGRLSLGEAAAVAGYSKTTFAEMLADYNVSLFNYPASDIRSDAARI